MANEVKLSELHAELDAITYPATRDDVLAAFDDVVLRYADGEERLLDVVDRATEDVFVDPDDLEAAIYDNLPTEVVGEPHPSEGDG